MAAALLEHHSMGRIVVKSAGSAPGHQVNPVAVAALAEWGINIAAREPKALQTKTVEASDVVITMGCGDACPVFPGKRYLDWELPDPAGQGIGAVRAVRDEIDHRVRGLLYELLNENAT
jgi:arsenate reductase